MFCKVYKRIIYKHDIKLIVFFRLLILFDTVLLNQDLRHTRQISLSVHTVTLCRNTL